jgi:hypothetical protein
VTNGGWIGVGSEQNSQLSIQPSNASWKSNSNFYWESCDPSVATISETGRITGVSNGYAQIIVTHKPTGTSYTFYMTVGVAMNDGTYYAMNKSTGRYLSVEGSSVAENAFVEVWSFLSDSQERWQITYSGSGYYRIKSVLSGKYLTVSGGSTSAGANVVQVSQMSTANHIKITKTPTGAFKLAAMTGESNNCCIGIQSSATQNGTNCSQLIYTDDADYRDEWNLYRLGEYNVSVVTVYDNAYANRYSGAYSRISNQILILQEKYLREFGITVNNISLTLFSSYADTNCTTNYNVECNHASEDLCKNSRIYSNNTVGLESYHHTNIYNIMARIPFPDLTSFVKVAYIGHEICTEDNHTSHPYYGLTYPTIGLASVTNFYSETSETKTLLHEFGHFYGVIDHYGGSAKSTEQMKNETGNNGYNRNCIYGENKESLLVLSEFTICDGCKDRIMTNINRFNH